MNQIREQKEKKKKISTEFTPDIIDTSQYDCLLTFKYSDMGYPSICRCRSFCAINSFLS